MRCPGQLISRADPGWVADALKTDTPRKFAPESLPAGDIEPLLAGNRTVGSQQIYGEVQ